MMTVREVLPSGNEQRAGLTAPRRPSQVTVRATARLRKRGQDLHLLLPLKRGGAASTLETGTKSLRQRFKGRTTARLRLLPM